jgi:hypothetical protein
MEDASPPPECDMAALVAAHVDGVTAVLQRHFPRWDVRDRTRCVNTAAMVLLLFLGRAAESHVDFCAVDAVLDRRAAAGDPAVDVRVARELRHRLLRADGARRLFYVLLTPGAFCARGRPRALFPGHVFVIEKTGGPRFRMFQSYIDRYTLDELAAAGGVDVPPDDMARHADRLVDLFEQRRWTPRLNAFWNHFARLAPPHAAAVGGPYAPMIGRRLRDVHLCARMVTLRDDECFEVARRELDALAADKPGVAARAAAFASWAARAAFGHMARWFRGQA